MSKVYVFGHKNPDTDSICSAIAYADLKTKLGLNAKPARLGEVNKETQFALEYFNVDYPVVLNNSEEAEEDVILVDHNEFQQSIDGIEKLNILEVIDHHRVANFETENPLYFRIEPVGCTATIIKKMYEENNQTISKEVAGLLLSAIISDSLLFKSPTCTLADEEAARELAKIAEVDLDVYGLEMLEAGTDLGDKTIVELLTMDAKEFHMNDYKVEIAQINAINTDDIYKHKDALEEEMNQMIKEKDLSLFLLVVTDILNSNSDALALGDAANKVESAFDVELVNNRAFLEGVVSRKKQIVTALTQAFTEA
ncbi:MAG TPA: manganese-dependent inorganic pyrophosphatase [Pseudogracilibacillus sp.]|nr:manganese-dependent inorganic pyrophosphatase [Pseudogracilibacillus sp.]